MSEDGIAIKPTVHHSNKQTNTQGVFVYTLYTNINAQSHNQMTIH